MEGNTHHRIALAAILAAAAVLFVWGIWRLAPHQLLGDEASVIGHALRLRFEDSVTAEFPRGGNLYPRLISLAAMLLLPYWYATGQLAAAGVADAHTWTAGAEVATVYDVAIAGRLLTVVAGVAAVYLCYRLARELSSRRGGLLAAAALTVTMGFALTAKYASEDVPQAALVALAVLLLVQAWRDGRDGRTVAMWPVGLAIGFAVGMKASSGILLAGYGVVLLAVVRAGTWDWRMAARRSVRAGAASVGAYILSTPGMVLAPAAWATDIAELFGWFTDTAGILNHYPDPSIVTVGGHFAVALSLPLFLLALAAVASGLVWLASGTVDRRLTVVYAVVLPYVGVLSIGRMTSYFRVVAVLPLVAVLVGVAVDRWLRAADGRPWRWAVRVAMAVALIFGAVYTSTAAASFATTRSDATAAVADLEPGTDVATLAHRLYLPRFPAGVTVHRYREPIAEPGANASAALTRVRNRCADVVVLSSFHYFRYVRSPSVRPDVADTLVWLFDGDGYRILQVVGPPVVRDYDVARKLRESVNFVHRARTNGNPTVVVLERVGAPSPTC